MAIIINEDQNKSIITPVIAIALVLLAVAFLAYYLFVVPPPVVDMEGTPGFNTVITFSRIKLDIEGITNSPVWTSLKKDSPVPPLATQIISAKTNLFQSFQAR